jgi:hypothetical protein
MISLPERLGYSNLALLEVWMSTWKSADMQYKNALEAHSAGFTG